MSHDLDDAAAELAAWEAQKARIDARIADRLTKPDAPVVPAPKFPAPLRNRVENFGYNFGPTIEAYMDEMRADAANRPGAAKAMDALRDMMVRFVTQHDEFFKASGEREFAKALRDGSMTGTTFHSEKHAAMLGEAASMVDALKVQHVVETGGPKILRAPPAYSTGDFFASHGKQFDGYIAELRKLAKQQQPTLKDRADNMERMLKGLRENTQGFFHNKRDVALKQFMMEAYTIDKAYFSTNYGDAMRSAVKDFTRLQTIHADQGAMLIP